MKTHRLRAVLFLAFVVVLCASCSSGHAAVSGSSGGSSSGMGGAGNCTLEIDCKTLLSHMDALPSSKVSLVPADGVMLAERKVAFKDGETVFDVLARVCKEDKLQMESAGAVTAGAYVKGIGNIYEFDAGPASGWRYSVNGDYPGQSSSLQKVADGDAICWRYTCDLGADVGAGETQK